ncbi:hypothetical protein AA0112_g7536 [Alternaria arborescens]|uniref:hypothetical protein n=1 Tax=Alternaria arborescens TaxID=156630 RepID=UPI001075680B|nr:hypothetical protein AA0111_g8043 [Alternaria arborescens]RYN28511.1 hypothetical protein AA0112_g7536 [Alternaria arborescens]RYO26591.1 hypothetical protein AA0111_g8043 [Alternaria arborescens]
MITDSQLYSLAIFLGSAAMLLIVLYHFLEVNSDDHKVEEKPKAAAGKIKAMLLHENGLCEGPRISIANQGDAHQMEAWSSGVRNMAN